MRRLPFFKYLVMNSGMAVRKWHRRIIGECERRLGRELSETEALFVTSRGGFIALEIIDDSVNSLEGEALEQYLNSDVEEN